MKKLFAATLLVLLSLQYGHLSELNITLSKAGDFALKKFMRENFHTGAGLKDEEYYGR